MRVLGISVTDAAGHFVFDEDKPDTGPHRLQAAYKGVNYNKLVTPNMATLKLELDIYEATKSTVAQIAQQTLVLEPSKSQTAVAKPFSSRTTRTPLTTTPNLVTFAFYLPSVANEQIRMNAQDPDGMPLLEPI
jgi:hypothetical protein